MASIVNYVANGSTNQFQIPFTYINQTDVAVTVDGTTPTFTFLNATTINIAATPASGAKITVKRVTPVTALVDFTDGSTLFEADLDLAHLQNRLIAEESRERADNAIDTLNANISNINTVAGIEANVTTVAGNNANVTTVAGNDANITTVAGNITDVNSVATNMTEVLSADTNAATATTKAAEAVVSANTASAQATISTTKAGESATSAAASLASKNAAAASESNAATSETNAANSATSSANSASASSSSASGASGSASTATTKAAEALTSANNAATSATNSANSASTATTKASEASTSETNAAASQVSAASSATTATTQAGIATTKAAEAAASATSIGNAETTTTANAVAAANSAAAAATALDSFDDRYLGVKSSDPTVDNDGNALAQGALYFSSSSSAMQVYDGANWIAASSSGVASLTLFEYTATAGQTAFTGSDDNGLSMSFIAANLLVTMNGVILDPSDFTTSGGVTVTLGSGAAVGDIVNIYAFKSFQVSDTVSASSGGTFAGAVSFNGNVGIGTSSPTSKLSVESSLADNNTALIKNTSGTGVNYGLEIAAGTNSTDHALHVTSSTGTSLLRVNGAGNVGIGTSSPSLGSNGTGLHIKGASGDYGVLKVDSSTTSEEGWVQFSNNGVDKFRIASDSSTNLKFIHSGVVERMRIDSSGNVGIGTTSPANYSNYTTLNLGQGGTGSILQLDGSTSGHYHLVQNNNGAMIISADQGNAVGSTTINFLTDGAERMRIGSSGNVGIGGTPDSGRKLHIEGGDATVGITLKDTAGGQFGINSDGGSLIFKSDTANSTRMQINVHGRTSGGATTDYRGSSNETTGSWSLGENGNLVGAAYQDIPIIANRMGNDGYAVSIRRRGTQIGGINISGTTTQYITSSDYRLKENVVDLTGASARVNQLDVKRFNWIADDTNTAVDGFLAHEVATVVPEAITGTKDAMRDEEYEVTPAVEATYDDDGNELTAAVEAVMGTRSVPDYQGIDQSKLVPLLTAALQEALTEIASLKTRVEALEDI
ncbi:phage tail fiber protein [bacterium]|nr:phage tail fiber protein [bacterium]